MSATVQEILEFLERWAPPATAQSYDNVGLQVGRLGADVTRAVVALDMTPDVLREAESVGAELIVTHHPLLFKGVKQLTEGPLVPELALRLAEAGVALVSAHTNLDAAVGGVNFELARRLGLQHVAVLTGMDGALRKLVVFVPEEHARNVHTAMADAGAGHIGAYEACAFQTPGTGFFRASPGSRPAVGSTGDHLEHVAEVRLEMQVPSWLVPDVVRAMTAAHPYEEVAHDIYPLDQASLAAGLGAVGELGQPEPLRAFLDRVCAALGTRAVRFAGNEDMTVQRVAVCGGSGSSFLPAAHAAGAHAYVTSDVTYHTWFDLMRGDGSLTMAMVDPGHYESERCTEELLCNRLSDAFPDVSWHVTTTRTSPVKNWIGSHDMQRT